MKLIDHLSPVIFLLDFARFPEWADAFSGEGFYNPYVMIADEMRDELGG